MFVNLSGLQATSTAKFVGCSKYIKNLQSCTKIFKLGKMRNAAQSKSNDVLMPNTIDFLKRKTVWENLFPGFFNKRNNFLKGVL